MLNVDDGPEPTHEKKKDFPLPPGIRASLFKFPTLL